MQILREADSARLRASLRAMLPAIVTLVILVGMLMVLGTIFKSASEERASSEVLLAYFAQIVLYVVLIGTAVWGATKLESRDYADFGLNIDANWGLNFTVGMIISLIGIMASLWWANIRGFRDVNLTAAGIIGPNKPLVLGIVFAVFICHFLLGNIYEEVIYRRIILGNFMEGLTARGISPKRAVILATTVSLLLFGMYHIPLRGNLVVVIDAALAGIPFALAYLLTRELGLPIGIHFGRILLEFSRGMTIGEFEIVPVVNLTQNTLSANLELKLVRIGLICLFILTWVYLRHGEIQLADPIYQRNGERSATD